jgi:hypothetical protein
MFLIRKWHIFLILLCASLYVSAENKVTIAAAQKIEGEGRLHLVFSSSGEREPRFYSAWPVKGIEPLFSIDLEGFSADQRVVIDDKVSGFPYQSLNSIPEGEWFILPKTTIQKL